MRWTWQEFAALLVVAGALYFLYYRFRPARDRDSLVKPQGRLARGMEAARRERDEQDE